jgi:site-specific DNA recombinase
MVRLTKVLAEADVEIDNASKSTTEVEATLEAALKVTTHCQTHYVTAPAHISRQINQGFFEKLFIDEDGHVERAEPFAVLLRIGRAHSQVRLGDSEDV